MLPVMNLSSHRKRLLLLGIGALIASSVAAQAARGYFLPPIFNPKPVTSQP